MCLKLYSLRHNSILLHSGLNLAWYYWLSIRFSCCLKMKSVENILGYIGGQFYRFLRSCKPQENLWNDSRKYPKMFKTGFIFSQQKSSLHQNFRRDHATMQPQGCFVPFLGNLFIFWNEEIILLSSSRAF